MERAVLDAYNDAVLEAITSRFDIDIETCRLIAQSENFVYDCRHKGEKAILRITPGASRDLNAVRGELEWINFLSANGMSVASPIRSTSGEMIAVFNTDRLQFLTVLFKRARGREVRREDWTPEFFEEWGRVLGRMHFLQSTFVPSRAEYRRPQWDQEYTVTAAPGVLAKDQEILEMHSALVNEVKALPSDADSFGLIHSDFEDENFFLDGSTITAFDFEESQYHWFAYDIASVLREGTWRMPGVETHREESLRSFARRLLHGYRQEKTIDPYWLKKLSLFGRLRDACCYVYFLGKRNERDLTAGEKVGLKAMRERIRRQIPPFELELS